MKKLLIILSLTCHIGFAQTGAIDSLKRQLSFISRYPESLQKDTLTCREIKAIMKAYVDINIDSAFHYNNLFIALCKKKGIKSELVYAYQYAGYLYQVRGDYHQSIRFHYKALPLADSLKEYTRAAASLGWLAHAYTSLKEFEKASIFCIKGLHVLKQHPDSYIQSSILNVQGAIFRQQGKYQDALNTNRELHDLAHREGHIWYEAQGLHAIGWVYKEMNEPAKALAFFNDALALAKKTGSVDLQGSILLNISNLHFKQKQWKKAMLYCNMARKAAQAVKNSSIEAEAFELLYKIFKNTGQPSLALESFENFVLLKDSLSKEKTDHRIEILQAQYDNVQKTNQLQRKQVELSANQRARNVLFFGTITILAIALLLFFNNKRLEAKNNEINGQKVLLEKARLELANANRTLEVRVDQRTQELVDANRELVRKNEEIKQALFKGQTIERKRVAIELHDNLSSLLSAVSMSMQYINARNLSESEQSVYQNVRQMIKNAYSEVRNISHNILPAELEKEGLASTLVALVSKLNQNSPLQFSLAIDGLDERPPAQIEFNIYSIVLELINNVIKHAQATSVTIDLHHDDSRIELVVSDDGIGLGKSAAKRGIGLQNIQTRLDSLGGTLRVIRPLELGTRIVIEVPIETSHLNGNVLIG